MSAGIEAQARAPFHLLAKPAGAACNLGCHYCFFLSKENLYPRESYLMPEHRLQRYIKQLFDSTPGQEVHVAWQGGEPMLRGLEFFKRAVQYAERYRKPHQIAVHTIQTNGTLIDETWAAFFKRHDFLVGISLDGPRALHDAYRVTKKGEGSFDEVMRGWRTLQRHGVRTNILCTVNAANADHPLEVYRFFRDELRAEFIQLIPIVERATPETLEAANRGWGGLRGSDRPLYRQEGSLVTSRSVTGAQFGDFLIGIFDEWVRRDIGKVFVTTFDVAMGSWMGQQNLCIVAERCGNALVLEHNGDVYSCDHYVEPDHLLGNIDRTPLRILVESEKQRRFGEAKSSTLPAYCKECPVLFACHGECPRNRFIETPTGEAGLNYLCAGYRKFFLHIDPHMKAMGELVRQGRFADEYVAGVTSG